MPDAKTQSPSDAEIAALRDQFGVTSDGRGIREFDQVAGFARAVLARWGAASPLGEPVVWRIDWPDEPELGHYFSEAACTTGRSTPLYTAPATVGEPVARETFALQALVAAGFVTQTKVDEAMALFDDVAQPAEPLRSPQPMPDLTALTERGKEALREGRVPLTEEQMAEACGWKAGMACKPLPRELRIARAIEAAHGITSKEGGPNAEI